METNVSNQNSQLGGIVEARLVPIQLVGWFIKVGSRALVSVISPDSWLPLHLVSQKSQAEESDDEENGFLVTTYRLTIPLHKQSAFNFYLLRDYLMRGCLIKLRYASGVSMVYGSRRHPLTGTIRNVSGTRHSDLSHDVIEVSAPGEGLLVGG